jgi:hypothetical protein
MPVNSVKKLRKKMTMSDNMMIGYDDIYDCFTMEHFRLRQRMTLTTKTYCSRLHIPFFNNSGRDFHSESANV